MPFPDAMQEFKVETSGLTAQYGQHSAGAVSAVTKSAVPKCLLIAALCESISDWKPHRRVDRLEIAWPGGRLDILNGIEANQMLTVPAGGEMLSRVLFAKLPD
jgi:hypothetical protein